MGSKRARKKFDCLAYRDRVQREIHEEIKGMSHQEQIDYFNHAAETGPLAEWWKRVGQTPARGSRRAPDRQG